MAQISARWVPDEACRPTIEEAPVFYPTVEVFCCKEYDPMSSQIFVSFICGSATGVFV